jgi:hypothetical protein
MGLARVLLAKIAAQFPVRGDDDLRQGKHEDQEKSELQKERLRAMERHIDSKSGWAHLVGSYLFIT